ncbi:hypothetical protein GOODEAATRI_002505, partial [Goodea atripinnis]
ISSVAFAAVAKTGPSPSCLSAANGGAGVGLPGHVSGWWPLSVSLRPLHDNTHCACQGIRYKGTTITIAHVEKSFKSCYAIAGRSLK